MAKGGKVTLEEQRSKRGRTSQGKGKAWQHAVAKIIALVTGVDKDDVHSNHGGTKGDEDVHRSEKAKRAFPFWIECKNEKRLSVPKWWAQLKEDREAAQCEEPGLIVSKLYGTSEALVTLSLDDFLDALYGPLTPSQRDQIRTLITLRSPKKGKPK